MKKIEWKKVTKYSQAIAIILFVAVFFLGFALGHSKNRMHKGDYKTYGKYEKKDMYQKHKYNDHKEQMKNEIKAELKKEMGIDKMEKEVEAVEA